MALLHEVRQPEQEHPPDRVDEEFGRSISPGLAHLEQADPGHGVDGVRRIALDVRQFGGAEALLLARRAVDQEPDRQPQKPAEAGHDEGRAPAPGQHHRRDDQRRHDGPDVGPGVEQAGGEGPLLLREPLGHGFQAAREGPALAHAQQHACADEAGERAGRGMGQVGDLPDQERYAEAPSGADPVDDAAERQVGDRVGALEPEHQVGIVGLAPAEFLGEVALQEADGLTVDVVDHHRDEQQGHDHPAVAADRRVAACLGRRSLMGGRRRGHDPILPGPRRPVFGRVEPAARGSGSRPGRRR